MLNQVMTLWAYETLNDRVERRDRLFKDPEWVSFLAKARPLLVTQETRILKPATFFNDRLKAILTIGQNAMTTNIVMKCLAGMALAALATTTALAQSDFPNRPIRMFVPFAAGGGIDITARIAAQSLSDVLGQQVVVQNQGGAGGALATDAVAKADLTAIRCSITRRPASCMRP